MIKKAVRKWLGIEVEEKWAVIGYAPYHYSKTFAATGKTGDFQGDAILLVSSRGRRLIRSPHIKDLRSPGALRIPHIAAILAWELGGYLPDAFEPAKSANARKPWKIPRGVVSMTAPKQEK